MITKVNGLPLAALGDFVREVQSASGAPKGVLRERVAPVLWADADAEYFGYSVQR